MQETARARSQKAFPHRLFNLTSLAGVGLILISVPSSLFFFLLELTSDASPAYVGVIYAVLLPLILLGLILIPIGMLLKRRKVRRGKIPGGPEQWVIDFSRPSHRYTVLILLVGAVVVSVIMAAGSYRVYQATESNSFCGQTCHSVMNPEWVTHQDTSHARVKCVECHIGSGAGWYFRSKLSGLKRLLAIAANTYSRPIPTPIHDLRPARETCEECHWPSKFIGYRELTRTYYLSSRKNPPFRIRMLIKIGGRKSKLAAGSGIHYHMLLATRVEYIARDAKRQNIAWVRIKRSDDSVTEYIDVDEPLTEDEKQTLEVRVMDCMDCHNRPAHKFIAPMNAVNSALEHKLISAELPYIKLEATKALDTAYETTEEAMAGLANHLRNFYRAKFPEVIEEQAEDLKRAIAQVQRIYRRSNFPEMKANWSAYPDNIGHRDWPGCFRCHNENMKSPEGFTIFTTCNKCHLILAQGTNIERAQEVNFSKGLPFFHPGDKEYVEEYSQCVDCHTGGAEVYE